MPRNPKTPLSRNQRFRYLSTAITAAVAVALVLLNLVTTYLTNRYPLTIDLTSDQVFQLTGQSKEYLAGLSQPVTLTVLNSRDSFESSGSYYHQALQVLEQYAKLSDNITLEYVDLLKNPAVASQYGDLNVGVSDIVVSGPNGSKVLTAYDLFNIESSYYGGYIASSKAEQALTSAIVGVTSGASAKAAFLTGHGEQYPSAFAQLLTSNNLEVTTLSPAVEEIPQDVDLLLMCAPTNDPDQEVLDKLSAFLSQEGKTLLYFADVGQPQLPRLSQFLAQWGIQVEEGTLFETDNTKIVNFNPYFSVTQISDYTLTGTMQDTSIPLTLPFARPLSTLFQQSMGRTVTVLLRSSQSSGLLPPDAGEDWQPAQEDLVGETPIAVLSQQSFEDGSSSQVVVISSLTALSDNLLSSGSFSNADYFLSVINSLTGREDVISIQAKTLGGQELGINTSQAITIGLFFLILLPAATLVCGLVIWLRRRHL